MSKGRRALAWSFSSEYLTTAFQFITTIVVSRLLTPAEIGIFSLAASFILLGQVLRDFGSGQYIVQEKELTDDRIRAAFSVTLVSGWTVAAAVFLLAPYAAGFFKEPGVEPVMHLLALNFMLIPFGSITMAYLQREMQFRRTMTVRISSSLVGSATSISCALAGLSYFSLAWGAVASSLAAALVANLMRPRGLPMLPGVKEIRRVIAFASQMSASTVIGQVSPAVSDMIIGKLLGAASLGLLSRSQGVIKLFETLVMRGLHPVLMPLFAEKHRDGQRLASSYLYGTSCLTGLLWPFYGGLSVLAPEFITVLFGPNWVAAAPLVQIACIGIMIRGPVMLSNHVLISTGNISLLLRRQLIAIPIGLIVTLLMAHISLTAVVLASAPLSLLWLLLLLPPVMHIAGIEGGRLKQALTPSLLVAIASTLTAWLTLIGLDRFEIESPVLRLLAGGLTGGLAFMIVLLRIDHPLAREGRGVLRKLTGRAPPDPA